MGHKLISILQFLNINESILSYWKNKINYRMTILYNTYIINAIISRRLSSLFLILLIYLCKTRKFLHEKTRFKD